MIPRLHVVTNAAVLRRESFTEECESVLQAGEGSIALHIRGRALEGRVLYEYVTGLLDAARLHDVPLIVNDRADVAAALSLPVHLGQHSLPPDAVGRVGRDIPVIGVSVHDVDEARAAEEGGADYVFIGTIFQSPSHPGRTGAGAELIAAVAGVCGLPLVAIGGVTADTVEKVVSKGAHGVAAISGVWDSDDPGAAVTDYLGAIRAATESQD